MLTKGCPLAPCLLQPPRRLISTQYAHRQGQTLQLRHGICHLGSIRTNAVQVEAVLPWPTDERARFEFGQIYASASKNTERLMERTRLVRQAEYERKLRTGGMCRGRAFDGQKAGEVLLMVFEIFLQDNASLQLRGER